MLIETPPPFRPTIIPTSDPDWNLMQVSLLQSVALAVEHAVPQAAEQIMDAAIDSWPVQTGRSRNALELKYEVDASTYAAILDCDIDYAPEIRDGETVADLIDAPAEAAIPVIVVDLERLITQIGRS